MLGMAKSAPKSTPLNRDEIKKRIRDEQQGITPGVAFGAKGGKKDDEPCPAISELGVPLPIRRKLENLCASHAELGKVQREAEKERNMITKAIKDLLDAHVPEDTPRFVVGSCRVTQFPQRRTEFSKDVCRDTLLGRGVPPAVVTAAMDAATTIKEVKTLLIRSIEEDES